MTGPRLLDTLQTLHGEQLYGACCLLFAALCGFIWLVKSYVGLWRAAKLEPRYSEWERHW